MYELVHDAQVQIQVQIKARGSVPCSLRLEQGGM